MSSDSESPGADTPPDGEPERRRQAPDEPREGYLALAKVVRAHGLRGEVRIVSFNPDAPNLQPGTRVTAGERELEIRQIRPAANGWVVAFRGITTRNDAEALHGLLLEVKEDSVSPEEGAYFVHQILGLQVYTDDGTLLGRIVEVLQPGANDVYVVAGERGEVLVPAIGEVVREIDLPSGRLIITPLPGLLNESL